MPTEGIDLDDSPSVPKPRAPPRLPGYELLRPLGRGGLGDVYSALRADGRKLAVKVVHPWLAQDREFVTGALIDLPTIARLRHERVIPVVEFGQRGDHVFIASELREGESLRTFRVRAGGNVPWPIAESIAVMILEGLAAAHAVQITHCALKPTNVLLSSDGTLRIGDFGSGRALDREQLPPEALPYLSPEQWQQNVPDARSDLFSLGVLLFELLTGTTPEAGQDVSEPQLILEHDLTLPGYLEGILLALLAKDPRCRFQTAEQVLEVFRQHSPMAVQPVDMVRPALANPAGWRTAWSSAQARRHFTRGVEAASTEPARTGVAVLEWLRAALLAPGKTEAEAKLQQVRPGRDLLNGARTLRITTLEESLRKHSASATGYLQLGRVCAADLHLVRAVICLVKAALMNPRDTVAESELRKLIGEEADAILLPRLSRERRLLPKEEKPQHQQEPITPIPAASLPPPAYQIPVPPRGRSPWGDRAPTLIFAALLLGGIFFGIRQIGRFIRSTQRETIRQTEALRTATDNGNPGNNRTDTARVAAERNRIESDFSDAMMTVAAGSPESAEEALVTFRNKHPVNGHIADVQFFLGRSYFRQGKLEQARAELKNFVTQGAADPRIEEGRWLYFQALEGTGSTALALKQADLFVSQHPESPYLAQVMLRAAGLEARAGNEAAAHRRYKAIRDRPGLPDEVYRAAQDSDEQLTP